MRHVLAVLLLLALLLFLMVRKIAPDPYAYDEADYMYAASLGFIANYTDSPTLPITDFVRTGLAKGRDASQRQTLSEQIRASDDVVFYRHWHGPLYLYLLIPAARLGLNEHQVRAMMLAIPALTLALIYYGCLWLIPGRLGTFAALTGGLLFVSSNSVTGSTELAPHQLFALLSVTFLFALMKFIISGQSLYWYAAVIVAGLAFCTLEVAFVLIFTLVICGYVEHVRLVGKSLALFAVTVLVVWPAAIYKLSVVKGYLFMAYLAMFRKSPWGAEGFFEIWGHRVLDSPLELAAIMTSVVLYLRKAHAQKLRTYPLLVYAALMLAATARVVSSSPRYSLVFMPALDVFAALTLVPILAASSRRVVYAALAMFCGLFAINEYRVFNRTHNPDARPPAVLSYIRENRLEEHSLLVPQEDLAMIHYYFPRMHLHGYIDPIPPPSDGGILRRGYPVRIEPPR